MAEVDQRNVFDEDIFAYRVGKDGKVFITWHGKQVTVLQGKAAQKLLAKVQGAERRDVQLALAKVTGNFKRGNER